MSQQIALFEDQKPQIPLKPYTGKVIYETSGKAKEYRELACNLYSGCEHGCVYCYAPMVLNRVPEDFHKHVSVRTDILKALEKDAAGYANAGEKRQILFCFTCDPYSKIVSETTMITRLAIQILNRYGLGFCVLTKGGSRALKDIDLYTPEKDSFASTLTCLDDATSLEWEPGAALPDDRISTLQKFHEAGIPTWVSLEPVLDPVTVHQIIRRTAGFVDEFKVGVLNYHPKAKQIDWKRFGYETVDLLEKLGKKYYLKYDLRKAMGV